MSVLLYSKWCLSMMEEPWSLARGCALLQKKKRLDRKNKLQVRNARGISSAAQKLNDLDLLCLVEVVGPSVVDIVAESGSHHGKGI